MGFMSSVVHWPKEVPAQIESIEARDRRDCEALYERAESGEDQKELARWLAKHTIYSGRQVASWLGCGETRIRQLRQWAQEGFVGLPHSREKRAARANAQAPLKSKDNSHSQPTEKQADESYQKDVFDQACLILEEMSDTTRQRFFAYIKENYYHAE
jgi:hypothetical protein